MVSPVMALASPVSLPVAGERERLAAASRQFEAVFLRQMLAAARRVDFGDGLFEGQGLRTFRQLQDDHFAGIAAQTGALGLAKILEAQLARHLPAGD
ncbi:MAG: rod-binding protein [Novosphingobium sp.]|nr:rod-binding protein [Novosphingobium sp.]